MEKDNKPSLTLFFKIPKSSLKENQKEQEIQQNYRGRFSNIHFIHSNDIKSLMSVKNRQGSHFIFCNSERELNLQINENNYQDFFQIRRDDAFMGDIYNLPNAYSLIPWKYNVFFHSLKQNNNQVQKNNSINYIRSFFTCRSKDIYPDALSAYNLSLSELGLPWSAELVNHIEALERFKHNNLITNHVNIKYAIRRIRRKTTAKNPAIKKHMSIRAVLQYLLSGKDRYRVYPLAYPLAYTSMDIFIVPAKAFKNFIKQCEVLDNYGISTEIVIATSLILTVNNIIKRQDLKESSPIFIS